MSFINGGPMFAFLAATAIPLIIFLIFRRKFRRIEWAAMEFLIRAQKRTNKRLKIENLILLLLRTLIFLFIVGAILRPQLGATGMNPLGNPYSGSHFILVIDTSYSMGLKPDLGKEDTLFSRAMGQVKSLAQKFDKETEVTVIEMRDGAPSISMKNTMPPAGELEDKTLNNMKVSDYSSDFGDTLNQIELAIKDSQKPSQHLHFFTDAQKAVFTKLDNEGREVTGDESEKTYADILTSLSKNEKVAEIVVHKLTPSALKLSNLTITGITTSNSVIIKGEKTEIKVEITNFGNRAYNNFNVNLLVNTNNIDNGTVLVDQIGSGETKTVSFDNIRFPQAGSIFVEAALEKGKAIPDNDLETDNSYGVIVEVLANLNILVVNGSNTVLADEEIPDANYINRVLRCYSSNTDETVMNIRNLRPDESLPINKGRLDKDYDIVVLVNKSLILKEQIPILKEYVRNGGSLLIFLGGNVDKVFYNTDLYSEDGEGLLPAKLADQVGDATNRQNLDNFFLFYPRTKEKEMKIQDTSKADWYHPCFKTFSDFGVEGLVYSTMTYCFYGLELKSYFNQETNEYAKGVRVAADFLMPTTDEGAVLNGPAVIEKSFGNGKVIMFTTTGNDDWSDMAKDANLFVPLLTETVLYLANTKGGAASKLVGATLASSYSSDFEEKGRLQTPTNIGSGSEEVEIVGDPTQSGSSRYFFSVAGKSHYKGWYKAIFRLKDDTKIREAHKGEESLILSFAVNPKTKVEGNLLGMDKDEFRRKFPNIEEKKFTWDEWDPEAKDGGVKAEAAGSQEIWKYLAYAILAFLFLESILAQRFGNYNR